jgi:NAD(P)H-hydrate epimerase
VEAMGPYIVSMDGSTPHVLTCEQARRFDRIAIEKYGLTGLVLMENAGRGVVDVLIDVDPNVRRVAILCGKGNNAGDGFVIARHLAIRGAEATALLICPPDELAGDARVNFNVLARSDADIVDLSGAATSELPALLSRYASGATWLIDALLGTGATGAPREPMAAAISWMNAQAVRRLAVDVPSGLDCDTGEAAGIAVRADVTCTFGASKSGFASKGAPAFLGDVWIVSIGTPESVLTDVLGAG